MDFTLKIAVISSYASFMPIRRVDKSTFISFAIVLFQKSLRVQKIILTTKNMKICNTGDLR